MLHYIPDVAPDFIYSALKKILEDVDRAELRLELEAEALTSAHSSPVVGEGRECQGVPGAAR